MAVAKAFGLYWPGSVGTFSDGLDVPPLQVRTARANNGALILRDKDRDGDIFVLVTGQCPAFELRGWLTARDGKREEFRANPGGMGPAFFVPQSALRPISELMARLDTDNEPLIEAA
jgi:hypothetical protein